MEARKIPTRFALGIILEQFEFIREDFGDSEVMSTLTMIGHHDALFRLRHSREIDEFLFGSEAGQVDLGKARNANVFASFFACWVENPDETDETYPEPVSTEEALLATEEMVTLLGELEEESDGGLLLVRSIDQLRLCRDLESHGAILHFEGAEALGEDLEHLDRWYEEGLRSLGLVWSRPNVFGHGVPFLFPASPDTGPGLSRRGRELVAICNSLGIMLDLSHLNEAGFWDVAKLSDAPLVATHSNAHSLCPSARNLTDEQLKAIADSDGVVGINFCCSDLREDGEDDPETDIELVLDQIEYIAETTDIRHVALGTDFDGSVVPEQLDSLDRVPELLEGLRARGWSENDLDAFCHENWTRVLEETWQES